jgi:hypothetical protein
VDIAVERLFSAHPLWNINKIPFKSLDKATSITFIILFIFSFNRSLKNTDSNNSKQIAVLVVIMKPIHAKYLITASGERSKRYQTQ